MGATRGLASVLAAAPLLLPVCASANDDLVRGLIGIGSAIIANQAMQQRADEPRQQAVPYRRQQMRVQPGAATSPTEDPRQQRAEIQRRLNLLGYDAGRPDGVYGARTRRAIAMFQRSLGRTPDGRISSTEVAALYAATAQIAGDDAAGGADMPQLAAPGGGGEVGAFPQLGSAQDGESEGFPKLGTAGEGTAAGGFPKLGAQEPAAAGSGFPALGKPAATEDAAAMPALGKPSKGSAENFPTLEPDAAGKDAARAMPALGSAPEQKNAFPGMAAPEKGAEDASMPALGAPAEDGGATMPAMARAPAQDAAFPEVDATAQEDGDAMPALGTPPADAALPAPDAGNSPAPAPAEAASLDAELAKTVFGNRERQPNIGDVTLGLPREDAAKRLAKAGFAGCEGDAVPLKCRRDTDTLEDVVSLWASDEAGVWAIRRVITFKTPAPADFVGKQFQAGYPELMAGERAVSSSGSCPGGRLPDEGLTLIVDRMSTILGGADDAVPDDMLGYAHACPLLYTIGLDGEQAVTQARLTFIDATPLIRRAAEARKKIEAEQKVQQDKLSKDLKL